MAIAKTNRAPIVQCRSFCLPERGSNNLERIFLYNLRDHLLETLHFKGGVMRIHAGDFVAKSRREVFLIAEHDVYERGNASVNILRLLLSAVRLPQRSAVVQVIGNDRAVPPRCLHGFECNFWRRRSKRAEDAAGMKPARARVAENLIS